MRQRDLKARSELCLRWGIWKIRQAQTAGGRVAPRAGMPGQMLGGMGRIALNSNFQCTSEWAIQDLNL